jgi:hypothetical protein
MSGERTADPAPRLAAIRQRWMTRPFHCEDADHEALLEIAERAAALLEALRAPSEADCAYAIRRWIQRDDTDLHRDERPLYDALTALAEALGSEP